MARESRYFFHHGDCLNSWRTRLYTLETIGQILEFTNWEEMHELGELVDFRALGETIKTTIREFVDEMDNCGKAENKEFKTGEETHTD